MSENKPERFETGRRSSNPRWVSSREFCYFLRHNKKWWLLPILLILLLLGLLLLLSSSAAAPFIYTLF